MYSCSSAFHNAVKDGEPQRAMLIFSDAGFTNDDIDVATGIEFDDNFNLEEDIAIGQTLSNEIRFALFNDDGYLDNYPFGEFTATLGVRIGTASYTPVGTTTITTDSATWTGYAQSPYLRRAGSAVSSQPDFAVASLLAYDGKVYAFSSAGQYAVYNDETGANITGQNTVNAFMRDKAKKYWNGMGMYYNKNTRILTLRKDGTQERYEFVPLGVFIADRPNVPDSIRIDMTCYDRMLKFDKDWPGAAALGLTFPCTFATLLQKMCDYLDVPLKTTTFINSNAEIDEELDDFNSVTMRQVLGWIAEAAASNARFDRDGKLVLDWIRTGTNQSYSETDYMEFEKYWYQTQQITKLYNRSTGNGEDTTYGTGSVGYLIQDNPLLKGAT